ncbi:MAG: N-6 DNA methylase [Candidatus Delongbacteria bacterium]|nr:N-6 DNA methylase [Candidatus Delongbacteria bacterium]MBN2834105.1 N-6 DNA methylase [Candidatus Delongbacteria bacterium]
MRNSKNIDTIFYENLKTLGFHKDDDALFLTNCISNVPDEIKFYVNKANELNASAVYFRKLINGTYQPQIYLYDYTDNEFNSQNEIRLTEIHKKIWSSGECPLSCFFYKTEIKIIDCTTHISDDYKPNYLIEALKISEKANKLYNEQFAVKIKSGVFWEEEEVKNKFKFTNNSAYNKLIDNIHIIKTNLQNELKNKIQDIFINKIIVQSILIKYLEERIDTNGNELLSDKYFKKFENSKTFIDVLKNGKFVELLIALNDQKSGFNGNVFQWKSDELQLLKSIDLSLLADLLDTKKVNLASPQQEIIFPNWRYFEFKYIPVELISRLYEEFLGENKKDNGLYYTPAHLTKLIVDESLPLSKHKDINLKNFKILDPACGSGIFLVTAFKRLVQIWRLQNSMDYPSLSVLKNLLKNIYGIDKEEQAVELASFSLSLALCNELQPIEIINKLKFDDLRETNLISSDFFEVSDEIKNIKFDLIIGNPPFNRGAISSYSDVWQYKDKAVKIPQGQIALKFLSEATSYLKEKGLLCLIIKSSGLLYNSTSKDYKKILFSNFNVVQIFDFTALARNKSLWDNGADVASAAIFLKNEKPDVNQNILHLTFRRTKATKERIVFEIDDYDLHFIDRITAIENQYIWKNNLLGGGRIKILVEKVKNIPTLKDFLKNNNSIIEEGFEIGTKDKFNPDYIYELKTLPTNAISENGIDYSLLNNIDKNIKFSKIPVEDAFKAPNLIVWENIGENNFPMFFNDTSFSFKRRIVSIKSLDNNIELLNNVLSSFNANYLFYKFYFLTTSGETLINRNNTFLLKDLRNVPFVTENIYSEYDKKIISDVTDYLEDFFISGENSKAVKPIPQSKFVEVFSNYGNEFSKVLNLIYEEKNKKFRLSDVVKLKNSYIATIFKYDTQKAETIYHSDNSKLNLKSLSDFEISKQLTVNRVIKLYPDKDSIVFVKPNQYRYWLSLIAYRDADKCFSDLSKLGY